MRIAEIIGTVTLGHCHPSLEKARLRLARPLSQDDLLSDEPSGQSSEVLVVYDELGAGQGSRIAMAEGPEAAQPFRPQLKPVNAYNAAILDQIDIERPTKKK